MSSAKEELTPCYAKLSGATVSVLIYDFDCFSLICTACFQFSYKKQNPVLLWQTHDVEILMQKMQLIS